MSEDFNLFSIAFAAVYGDAIKRVERNEEFSNTEAQDAALRGVDKMVKLMYMTAMQVDPHASINPGTLGEVSVTLIGNVITNMVMHLAKQGERRELFKEILTDLTDIYESIEHIHSEAKKDKLRFKTAEDFIAYMTSQPTTEKAIKTTHEAPEAVQ